MGGADGESRSVSSVYEAAYKAYLKTVQEGLAELDIEAVDVGATARHSVVAIHTHFLNTFVHTHGVHTHGFHTHFVHTHFVNTQQTFGTIGTESTLATSPAIG